MGQSTKVSITFAFYNVGKTEQHTCNYVLWFYVKLDYTGKYALENIHV
jgi:hypothetical protein